MRTTLLAEREECCDEMPVPDDGVLDFVLGSDVRSGSEAIVWGKGERDALVDWWDNWEADRDSGGFDASDVLRSCSAVEEIALLLLVLFV